MTWMKAKLHGGIKDLIHLEPKGMGASLQVGLSLGIFLG
jgi:hypothetical protein